MEKKLTKEAFSTLFKDDFQLTLYAIQLAQQQIEAGNEDLSLPKMLEEIRKHYPNVTLPAPQRVEQEGASEKEHAK